MNREPADDPTIAELKHGIWWLSKCPVCGLAIHLRNAVLEPHVLPILVVGWHNDLRDPRHVCRQSLYPMFRSTLN